MELDLRVTFLGAMISRCHRPAAPEVLPAVPGRTMVRTPGSLPLLRPLHPPGRMVASHPVTDRTFAASC